MIIELDKWGKMGVLVERMRFVRGVVCLLVGLFLSSAFAEAVEVLCSG